MEFTNRLGPNMENFREVHDRADEFMDKTALNKQTASRSLSVNWQATIRLVKELNAGQGTSARTSR